MGRMGLTEKAKELADAALLKAGEVSERAAGKAAELSDAAREKAPGYVDRAADLAVKAVDAAASGVDRATGGRFHDKLEDATAKVEERLDRPRSATDGPADAPTVVVEPDPAPPAPGDVAGQAGAPITPAATNPDATDPGTSTGGTPKPAP